MLEYHYWGFPAAELLLYNEIPFEKRDCLDKQSFHHLQFEVRRKARMSSISAVIGKSLSWILIISQF
jgi:hypothetical protein